MKTTFDPAVRLLLRHEGGFVNHPADPGGMTNLGVTRKAWEEYKGHPVTEQDMRGLTEATVRPFYKTRYWDAIRGDELPVGVDFCVFDACVNSGAKRAAIFLQQAAGAMPDGAIGPGTMKAISGHNAKALILNVSEARLAFLKSLPTWTTFGKGWERRVNEVEDESMALAGSHK